MLTILGVVIAMFGVMVSGGFFLLSRIDGVRESLGARIDEQGGALTARIDALIRSA